MDPARDDATPPEAGTPVRRLLVIDDDVELCELVAEFLVREGFAAEFAHDGDRGLAAALEGGHQAIILDVMLPRLGGFEVLRRIRERKRTPILMLTARGDHVDRIVGLEMGADDYIPKPFDPRELVARLRAVLRRVEGPPPGEAQPEPLVVDDLRLDPGAREAWRARRRLDLTAVEFDLLAALLGAAGRVVSREELSRAVLGRAYQAFDRSIDMHVSHLRRKLQDGGGDTLIKTVRSAGYLLARRSTSEPE
jgi:two-component system response regulator CpxR